MKKIYDLDSIVEEGRYKGKKVAEIAEKNKKEIMRLIREKGYVFSDSVLEACNFVKKVKNVRVENVIVEHEKDNHTYEKDTMSVSRILKAISTIENGELYFSDIENSINSDEVKNEEEENE